MSNLSSQLVDSHVHQWDLTQCDYPWLEAEGLPETYEQLRTSFNLSDAQPDLDAAGVTAVVLVQAADSECDTIAMMKVAAETSLVAGVVGWIDLTDPDRASDAIERAANSGPLVGVRHMIHEESDPAWILQPEVLASLEQLAGRDLVFDLVGTELDHLRSLLVLADRIPELRVVIDHLNKPPVGTPMMGSWVELIHESSQRPNVYGKVSGLHNVSPRQNWDASDLRPAFDTALGSFGSQRLLYGGDWPVCNVGGGYTKQHEAFVDLLADMDEAAVDDICWRTSKTVYRLG